MTLDYAGLSNPGKVRDNNEDAWLACAAGTGQTLLLVADGVGGRDAGELASATVVDVFEALARSGKFAAAEDPALAPMLLSMAAQKAHVAIAERARDAAQPLSMSCTLSVALVSGDCAHVLQVGDSRVYHWRGGTLTQLTEDQTVAMQLLRDGRISAAQLASHPDRNTLSQSLGLEAEGAPLTPALSQCALASGDWLLLCSDGLTDLVDDEGIAKELAAAGDPQSAAQALVAAALAAGGHDNVTVLVAER